MSIYKDGGLIGQNFPFQSWMWVFEDSIGCYENNTSNKGYFPTYYDCEYNVIDYYDWCDSVHNARNYYHQHFVEVNSW